MQYQNQLSRGKFLPTSFPLRMAPPHSHPCAFTSIGRRCWLCGENSCAASVQCWSPCPRRSAVSLLCYLARSCRPPEKDWGRAILALLWGSCCRAGHRVQKLNPGWKEASGTCGSSRWMRGSHACPGSSWRLWKESGFLGSCILVGFSPWLLQAGCSQGFFLRAPLWVVSPVLGS